MNIPETGYEGGINAEIAEIMQVNTSPLNPLSKVTSPLNPLSAREGEKREKKGYTIIYRGKLAPLPLIPSQKSPLPLIPSPQERGINLT